MKNFSDFGIERPSPSFVGPRIPLESILNQEIIIEKFVIEDSLYQNKKRLKTQIKWNGVYYINFSNSESLKTMIQKLPKEAFPIKTKIIYENKTFYFT